MCMSKITQIFDPPSEEIFEAYKIISTDTPESDWWTGYYRYQHDYPKDAWVVNTNFEELNCEDHKADYIGWMTTGEKYISGFHAYQVPESIDIPWKRTKVYLRKVRLKGLNPCEIVNISRGEKYPMGVCYVADEIYVPGKTEGPPELFPPKEGKKDE